jgi:hypothetical protein
LIAEQRADWEKEGDELRSRDMKMNPSELEMRERHHHQEIKLFASILPGDSSNGSSIVVRNISSYRRDFL